MNPAYFITGTDTDVGKTTVAAGLLFAAREAGLGTVLLDRREDYAQPRIGEAANGHQRVEDFSEITA